MRSATIDKEEAHRAIDTATNMFPTLDPRGIGPHNEPYEPNQHSFGTDMSLEQVGTSIEFLKANGVAQRMDSYELKHLVEQWGRTNGLAPYVSNGALICAALYLKVAYDVDHLGRFVVG